MNLMVLCTQLIDRSFTIAAMRQDTATCVVLVNVSVSCCLTGLPVVRLVDQARRRALTRSPQRRAVHSPASHLRTGGHFSCPHRVLRPCSTPIASTGLRPTSTITSETCSMANPTSIASPDLGNDPVEDKPPPRALSRRELRKKQKKVAIGGGPENPGVRCDSHFFQRNGTLTPPQKGKSQTEPQRENLETENLELKRLEACRNPHIFRHDSILTAAGGEGARRTRT